MVLFFALKHLSSCAQKKFNKQPKVDILSVAITRYILLFITRCIVCLVFVVRCKRKLCQLNFITKNAMLRETIVWARAVVVEDLKVTFRGKRWKDSVMVRAWVKEKSGEFQVSE